jgi:hypothetical protein
MRKSMLVLWILKGCSTPGELTKVVRVPLEYSLLIRTSHGSTHVAFSTRPRRNTLCPSSLVNLGSMVSTKLGWEMPSSASSVPPQLNDEVISENERNLEVTAVQIDDDSEVSTCSDAAAALDAMFYTCSTGRSFIFYFIST